MRRYQRTLARPSRRTGPDASNSGSNRSARDGGHAEEGILAAVGQESPPGPRGFRSMADVSHARNRWLLMGYVAHEVSVGARSRSKGDVAHARILHVEYEVPTINRGARTRVRTWVRTRTAEWKPGFHRPYEASADSRSSARRAGHQVTRG